MARVHKIKDEGHPEDRVLGPYRHAQVTTRGAALADALEEDWRTRDKLTHRAALASACSLLSHRAKRLHTLYAGKFGHERDEGERRAELDLEESIREIVAWINPAIGVAFNLDPRQYPVRLALPSKRYNNLADDWGIGL